VTYNCCLPCVRAFTNAKESDVPLDIELRGWKDGKMQLAIDGTVLPQESNDIQLARLETEVTTWKEWKAAHPNTDIYTGMPGSIGDGAD
jgi:hypothetical protein